MSKYTKRFLGQEGIDVPEYVHAKKKRADDKKPITFWVPTEKKEKYDELQAKTARDYGKFLIDLVVSSIDKTDVKDEAS